MPSTRSSRLAVALDINLSLVGIREYFDGIHSGRGIGSNGRKGIHGKQGASGGISKRLGGHDADAQARIAAGSPADDNGLHVARFPLLLPQQLSHAWSEIAARAARLVQPAPSQQPPAKSQ